MRPAQRLLLATLLSGVLVGGCASTGEPAQGSHTEARPLTEPMEQTFVPVGDRLSSVGVLVATYGVDGPGGVLRMDLEGAGQRREAAADLSQVSDGTWVHLGVQPVQDSAGQRFTATFSYEGQQPVALYVNPYDPYPQGNLRPGNGDLAFEIGYTDRVGILRTALGRVAEHFAANLAQDPLFASLWGASVLVVLALLVAAVRVERRSRRPGGRPRGSWMDARGNR